MVSEYGNAVYEVKTERQRDELIAKGYHEEKPKEKNKTTSKKGSKVK